MSVDGTVLALGFVSGLAGLQALSSRGSRARSADRETAVDAGMKALATRANLDAICDFAVTFASTRPAPTPTQRALLAHRFAKLPADASMLLEHYRERGLDDDGLRVVGLAVLDPGTENMPPVGIGSILSRHRKTGFPTGAGLPRIGSLYPRAWALDALESAAILLRRAERADTLAPVIQDPLLAAVRVYYAGIARTIETGDPIHALEADHRFFSTSGYGLPDVPTPLAVRLALTATKSAFKVATMSGFTIAWWNTAIAAQATERDLQRAGLAESEHGKTARTPAESARFRAWRRMTLAYLLEESGVAPAVLADIYAARAMRKRLRRAASPRVRV